MQQYFIKGKAEKKVTITDKDTIKHMFQVMRLADEAEVVLVFDDGVKYLAKVTNSMAHELEIIELCQIRWNCLLKWLLLLDFLKAIS